MISYDPATQTLEVEKLGTPTGALSCYAGIDIMQPQQGFMQDKIIVSHTRFREHMDVNC